ncbi:hypothetical protein [Polaribacter sp. Z014]|nr:hypothetical protein [Polaribacter sp. Z014]
MIAKDNKHYELSIGYDLVTVKLLMPEDKEELALNRLFINLQRR